MLRSLRSSTGHHGSGSPTGEGPHPVIAVVAVLLASFALVGGFQAPAGTLVEPWIDTSNRDAVAVAWALEGSRDTPDMAWTGSYDECSAGEASRRLGLATVARVNFYRGMAGVPASVRLNEEYSDKAQHAALTMSATGRLSHAPDDSFECLDQTGREAAANSNLYLGRIGPAAIDGYIEDPGDRNRDVGHRNTILHPPTTEMGVGHVAGREGSYAANALWVFDDRVFDDNPSVREPAGFVAWPPRGYVPAELVHPRWSFGLAGADFDAATVSMTAAGQPVELEVVTRHSLPGYVPSPIVVWEPDPAAWAVLAGEGWPDGRRDDLTIRVRVEGVVVDGATRHFDYDVTLMAPPGFGSGNGLVIDAALRTTDRAAGLLASLAPGSD